MNKVSMPMEPQGLFKVFLRVNYRDLNGNDVAKKVCVNTVYSIDYEGALKMYKSFEELNPDQYLHYTFTIYG
jgi:hypothetical protein